MALRSFGLLELRGGTMEYSATHSNQQQQPAFSPHSLASAEDRLAELRLQAPPVTWWMPVIQVVPCLSDHGVIEKLTD